MLVVQPNATDVCDCANCTARRLRDNNSFSVPDSIGLMCLRASLIASSADEASSKVDYILTLAKDGNKEFRDGKAVIDGTKEQTTLASDTSAGTPLQGTFSRSTRLSCERLPVKGSVLSWAGRRITAEQMPSVTKFLREHDPKVERLVLNDNAIGDAGAQELASHLRSDTTLTYLSMHRCAIGDAGILQLAEALSVNTTLQSLFLTGNRASPAAVAELNAANDRRPLPMAGLCGLVV